VQRTLLLIPMAWAALALPCAAGESPFSEQAVLATPAPGKFIQLSREQAAQPGYSSKDRFVATYYFYWYDDASGQHFRNPDGSDGMTDHPADPKGYSYKRAAWHRKQMEDMMAAGIDVCLPVFWGCPANRAKPGEGESWTYAGLPPLVAAQEELIAEGRRPPRIGMFYDTSTLQYNAAGRRVDLRAPAGRAWFYATVRDFFSLIPPKLWATVDGRPLVLLYSAGFASAGTDDPRLLDYVRTHFAQDFGGATPYVVAEQSWRLPADSTYAWGAAFGLKVFGVASVGPGYDDHAVPGRTSPKAAREGGAFYQRAWNTLLAMQPSRRPNIVTIETWNEFHEATDIADSREFGRKYIELTQAYAAAWRAGEHRKPTGPYAAARAVSITFGPNGKADGLRSMIGADGQAGVTNAAGADCLQTLSNSFGNAQYLYFEVDDSFYFDSGGALRVTVEYLDEGAAPLALEYDSTDAAATLAGAYKDARSVVRTGTGAWKEATFTLSDPRMVNRQNASADFRLRTAGAPLKVRRVVATKAGA